VKYDVHLFPIVRVKVHGVEAGSQEEAIKKAEESTDFDNLFNKAPDIEYAEEVAYYLVDEVGDEEYERTRWHDGAFTSDPQKRNVNELIAALTDCRDALGEYLQSIESGKDDDAESAYQHADALLKEVPGG
jgi:hypothetical protein